MNGGAESHAVTSFDTGESEGQFYAPVDPSLIDPNGDLIPNQTVTIRIPGILTQTVTTGDTHWQDVYKIIAPAGEGEPKGYNSGAPFYYYYAIAYDYLTGTAGFSPLTTWIIGDYHAEHDSDLGDNGAIAVFGTLELADNFSSQRAIGVSGESTIRTLGNATLGGTLSGLAPLKIEGPGSLTLSGTSINTGPVLVDGATLLVDGELPPVVILADGTIGGNGTIGALVAAGGVISPGHSIGRFVVAGDAVLGPGSTYQVEVNPPDQSDQLVVAALSS